MRGPLYYMRRRQSLCSSAVKHRAAHRQVVRKILSLCARIKSQQSPPTFWISSSELIRLIHFMLSSPAFPEISTYDTGFLDIVLVLLNARDHLPAGFLVKLLCGQPIWCKTSLLAIVSFASNKILPTNTPSLKLSVASKHDRAEEAPRLLPNS